MQTPIHRQSNSTADNPFALDIPGELIKEAQEKRSFKLTEMIPPSVRDMLLMSGVGTGVGALVSAARGNHAGRGALQGGLGGLGLSGGLQLGRYVGSGGGTPGFVAGLGGVAGAGGGAYGGLLGGRALGDVIANAAGLRPDAKKEEAQEEEQEEEQEEVQEAKAAAALMRKQGGSLFYEQSKIINPDTGVPYELTGAMSRYNKNIATLIASLGIGVGMGGLAAFSKWKRRPSVLGLAGVPRSSTNAPLGISFLKRKLTRRKPEETAEMYGQRTAVRRKKLEEERAKRVDAMSLDEYAAFRKGTGDDLTELERQLAKTGSYIGDALKWVGRAWAAPFQPGLRPGEGRLKQQPVNMKTADTPGYPGWKPGDAGFMGSDMSDMVLYPSLVALLSGGWYGGNLLGDYLSNKRRKRDREDALSNAKYDYEEALERQFSQSPNVRARFEAENPEEEKKAAMPAEIGADLDNLYSDMEKYAQDAFPDVQIPFLDDGAAVPSLIGKSLGALGAIAIFTGIPIAHLVYKSVRKAPERRSTLGEAMRRRKVEMSRRQGGATPIHLTPGEAVNLEFRGPISGGSVYDKPDEEERILE